MTDSTQTAPTANAEEISATNTELASSISNPYWDEVKDSVREDTYFHELQVGFPDPLSPLDKYRDRTDLVTKYSWTITDPASLEFVRNYAGKQMIDPMAGSGYWSKLLIQLGVDVVSYDDHSWDRHTKYHHVLVPQGDAPQVVRRYPNHTLFLAWPPYSHSVGFQTVRNYRRDLAPNQRVIYIGESESGCTGDDNMFDEFRDHWTEIDCHQPIQWYGMHDRIYIFDRKSND